MNGPAPRQKACFPLVLALTIAACCSCAVAAYEEAGLQMSGSATSALAMAFEASGLDTKRPAPFALQPYVVTIAKAGGAFDVWFEGQTESEHKEVFISPQTGRVMEVADLKSTKGATDEAVLLPGIVAGEIIEGYRRAKKDGFKPIQTKAYNLRYWPNAGGIYIAFVPLQGVPPLYTTLPAPTPSPQLGCQYNCDHRVFYFVNVDNGRVRILTNIP